MKTNEIFLYYYFFFLEELLQTPSKKAELSKIKFQSEEANTDEYIKLYLKDVISNNNRIPDNYKIKDLKITKDGKTTTYPISLVKDCYIEQVQIPEELSAQQKSIIAAAKTSVYVNPDLFIKVNDGSTNEFVSVEIKTTKTNNIPGSSVQQVAPYEWTIFVKHNGTDVDVSCGYYMNAITDKLPFPDRSPRPQIGFDTMQKWNRKNRKVIASNVLSYEFKQEEEQFKLQCLQNWEEILCKEWMQTIQRTSTKSEKWFNNTIRMFSLDLLQMVKKDPSKLDGLISLLEKNIN